jgi:hypothetical protein
LILLGSCAYQHSKQNYTISSPGSPGLADFTLQVVELVKLYNCMRYLLSIDTIKRDISTQMILGFSGEPGLIHHSRLLGYILVRWKGYEILKPCVWHNLPVIFHSILADFSNVRR